MKSKLIFLLLPFFIACGQEAEVVDVNDAQSQIYAAAKFAADRCGSQIPNPPLIVVTKPIKRNLDLCTISITRTGCPFVGYPLPCLLIYSQNETGDLPWYVNFNGISKIQIK
ncbi:lipoprotein [Leptospira ryugenii]|uniref:Lipoprotein n=1 Tax=Leptospira ryugenii TaxID=1917863 RepID=A0A2P2E1W6_9LEPT|nr:hypothetical protein [Leptospira ryugenii]GBF50887.1 lipoprotein [Leptospira ryugenii]